MRATAASRCGGMEFRVAFCLVLWLANFSTTAGRNTDCSSKQASSIAQEDRLYDFVIIGGGTAGLTVATRLSEHAGFRVAVLEAGQLRSPDPIIDIPHNSGQGLGNPDFDWNFQSVPQRFGAERIIAHPRGKVVGGSSAINGMVWDRPSAEEINVWNELNANRENSWSFQNLLPFFKSAEKVEANIENPFPGVQHGPTGGESGPLLVSLNTVYSDVVIPFVQSVNRLGLPTNVDPENGRTAGVYNTLTSIDHLRGVRSYTTRDYFCPASARRNLDLFTGAQATRILFNASSGSEDHLASSVQFISEVGELQVLNVTKEVILSAGVVQTPQLLELSGIGNSSLLAEIGVDTLIDLPSVGENLQEHLFVTSSFELKPGFLTFDALRNNASFAAQEVAIYNKTHGGLLAATNPALLFAPIQQFATSARTGQLLDLFDDSVSMIKQPSPLQQLQYKIQRQWIVDGRVPQTEIIQVSKGEFVQEPNKSYTSTLSGLMHPIARGSIHINSTDPLLPPVIDGNFLSNDFDVQMLLEMLKFNRQIAGTEPTATIIVTEVSPGPNITSDEDIIAYLRSTFGVGSHILGTAPMAARNLGGVVGADLKVYGTRNLRIVDSSIIPLHVASHLQSIIYAIAEKLSKSLLQQYS